MAGLRLCIVLLKVSCWCCFYCLVIVLLMTDYKKMRGGWLGIDWLCSRGERKKKEMDRLCCVNMGVKKIHTYIEFCMQEEGSDCSFKSWGIKVLQVFCLFQCQVHSNAYCNKQGLTGILLKLRCFHNFKFEIRSWVSRQLKSVQWQNISSLIHQHSLINVCLFWMWYKQHHLRHFWTWQ